MCSSMDSIDAAAEKTYLLIQKLESISQVRLKINQ